MRFGCGEENGGLECRSCRSSRTYLFSCRNHHTLLAENCILRAISATSTSHSGLPKDELKVKEKRVVRNRVGNGDIPRKHLPFEKWWHRTCLTPHILDL